MSKEFALRVGSATVPMDNPSDDVRVKAVLALQKIARGKVFNGSPLNRHEAQTVARECLVELGLDWPKPGMRG